MQGWSENARFGSPDRLQSPPDALPSRGMALRKRTDAKLESEERHRSTSEDHSSCFPSVRPTKKAKRSRAWRVRRRSQCVLPSEEAVRPLSRRVLRLEERVSSSNKAKSPTNKAVYRAARPPTDPITSSTEPIGLPTDVKVEETHERRMPCPYSGRARDRPAVSAGVSVALSPRGRSASLRGPCRATPSRRPSPRDPSRRAPCRRSRAAASRACADSPPSW